MANTFPQLAMGRFSDQYKGQGLVSMHATNPQAFTHAELEQTIGQSFKDILHDVNLGFAPDEGTNDLRLTLAQYHYENCKSTDVITHAGAQEALFCAFHAILNKGDKVLAVAPIFEPLVQIPLNIGCELSYIHLDSDDNWSLDIDQIEKHFKLGCKLFVINFPHNPTGALISGKALRDIVTLCAKYDVWLLSDEVFRGLEHSINRRLPAVADIYHKGISVGVISKAFAIPGIRVGWLVCQNTELRQRIVDIKGYLSICNSQIDERLASVILQKTDKLLKRNLSLILKNKALLSRFNQIYQVKIDIVIPDSGCCLFVKIKDSVSSLSLVEKIINNNKYLLYPSLLFKTDVNALRIGYGNEVFETFINAIQA